MANPKPTPDYDAPAPARSSVPSSQAIGDGVSNGILFGWALAVIVLIIVGACCSMLDVTSGDGMTRTLALWGFIMFPVFTVVGGLAGAFHVRNRSRRSGLHADRQATIIGLND